MDETETPQTISAEPAVSRITFSELTSSDSKVLADLRQKIDGVPAEKSVVEADSYTGQSGGRSAIIAVENFKPVGYVQLKQNDKLPEKAKVDYDLSNHAHLARIGVLEEARGKGVGTKLLEKAEEWVKRQGKTGL